MMHLTYPKEKRITIRLSDKLNDYLLNKSIEYDMTLSEYIRIILESNMILHEREVSVIENNKCNINDKL